MWMNLQSETKTNWESVGLREMKYSNFKHKHEDGATRRDAAVILFRWKKNRCKKSTGTDFCYN